MIRRFFRSFFWAILLGFVLTWVYLGWVSASTREAVLVEDHYEGILDPVVMPGSFRFVAGRAIPGRVTLHRVYLGPRILKWNYKYGLAQSEVLGLDETFYIRLSLRLEYKIDPARLSTLFLELDRPDFRRLSAYLRFRLRLIADRFIKSIYLSDRDIPNLESRIQDWLRNGEGLSAFNRELSDSGIQIRRVIPVKIYVPDQNRYAAMLRLGEQALLGLKLERIRKIHAARMERDASRIRDRAYFARLDEMGRLLRRYPNLQEYVTMELVGDRVKVLVLPRERFLEGAKGGGLQRSRVEQLLERLNARSSSRDSLTQDDAFDDETGLRESADTKARPNPPVANAGRQARFQDLTPP